MKCQRLRNGLWLAGLLASCAGSDPSSSSTVESPQPDGGLGERPALSREQENNLGLAVSSSDVSSLSLDEYGCDSALEFERNECGPNLAPSRVTCTGLSSTENVDNSPCDQRWEGCSDSNVYRVHCVPQELTAGQAGLACGCLVNGRVRGFFEDSGCPLSQETVNEGCNWSIRWGDLR